MSVGYRARGAGVGWRRTARLTAAVALAALAVPLGGVGRAPAAQAAADGPTLRVALNTGIDTLNPFTAVRLASTQVGRFMYEFLTTYTAGDQTPTPGLAESWDPPKTDGVTWTFHIRKGMSWSDGQPITAKDPAFTYNLMMTNTDAATANGSYTANFASVTATDDYTLVVKTKKPYSTMLSLDIPVVPEHVWSKVKNVGEFTNEDTSQPVVGSGPFLLAGYEEGQFVKLKANPTYWRGAPKIGELDLVSYTNTDAAVQALRKGDVDVVYGLTASQFDALKGQPNITLSDGHNRRFTSLMINPGAATKSGAAIGNGNPVLKDVVVRQAIAQALDLKTLVDRVQQGHAEMGASIIPPVFPAYHWTPSDSEKRAFDPGAANSALDAAGYPKGTDGIRTDKGGKKLTLRLLAISDDPTAAQEAEFVKGWLADIGIQVKPEYKSDTQVSDDTTGGRYDLAFSGWSVNPDPDQMLALETCGQRPEANGKGGSTADFFCNADYDRMYAEQAAEIDRAKRQQIVKDMQKLLYEQVPSVVLTYTNNLEAYRGDRFSHFDKQPADVGVITGQNGYWGLYTATPAGVATGAAADDGGNSGVVIGVVVAVVVVAGLAGAAVMRRRKSTADERE
jgi:peptide/nickel transport system substrate-binding protein